MADGKLRCALMANDGYGGLVFSELLRHEIDVVAVFSGGKSLQTRLRALHRRYLTSPKKRRDLLARIREKAQTFRDEPLPARSFGSAVLPIAESNRIPCFPGIFVHDEKCATILRELGVDVILVATFNQFLPKAVIDSARIAAVNVHPSLLPAHRGGFPEFAAVCAGDRVSGVTFHHLEVKFDTGGILLQRECAIDPDDTTLSLKVKLAELARATVPEFLALVRKSDLAGRPQRSDGASYTRLRQGFDVIDSSWTRSRIRSLVNACWDTEEIGRPRIDVDGRTVYAISCGERGLKYPASDGDLFFDTIRYGHRLYSDRALESLIANW